MLRDEIAERRYPHRSQGGESVIPPGSPIEDLERGIEEMGWQERGKVDRKETEEVQRRGNGPDPNRNSQH